MDVDARALIFYPRFRHNPRMFKSENDLAIVIPSTPKDTIPRHYPLPGETSVGEFLM